MVPERRKSGLDAEAENAVIAALVTVLAMAGTVWLIAVLAWAL